MVPWGAIGSNDDRYLSKWTVNDQAEVSCLPDQLEPRVGKKGWGRNKERAKRTRLHFFFRKWFLQVALVGQEATPPISAAPTSGLPITFMNYCQESPGLPARYTTPYPHLSSLVLSATWQNGISSAAHISRGRSTETLASWFRFSGSWQLGIELWGRSNSNINNCAIYW